MHRIILLIFLGFSSIFCLATQVEINGVADDFKTKKLVLYRYADPYSKVPQEIESCLIGEDGHFSIGSDFTEIEEVFLRISWFTAKMYVKPGSNYQIIFPSFDDTQLISFSKELFLQPDFIDLPANDPNLLIAKFNYGYEKFFADHYVEIAKGNSPGSNRFKKSKRNKAQDLMVGNDSLKTNAHYEGHSFADLVRSFSDSISQSYSAEDSFVKDYVKYALAQLQMSSGISRKEVFGNHLMNSSLPINHPEFALFIESFYYNFLVDLEQLGKVRKLRPAIEEYQNLDSLRMALDGSDFSRNDSLKNLVSIVALEDAWYKKQFNRRAIETCLKQHDESGEDSWNSVISARVLQNLSRRMPGFKPADVILLDAGGNRASWDEFNGEITYLVSMSTWSNSSLEELTLLEKLSDKYARQIKFVVLSLDEDFSKFKDFVSRNHRNNWTFLYGMSDPFVREKLDLWSVPSFFLLAPNGTFINGNELSPSQGVEAKFYKLLVEDEKKNKIKVWDD